MYELQVTDMDVVFEVIGQLESFQISREELEVNFLDISYYENEKKICLYQSMPRMSTKNIYLLAPYFLFHFKRILRRLIFCIVQSHDPGFA